MLISTFVSAQETEQEQDSTTTKFSFGKLKMPNPNSIVAKYTYDTALDRYVYTEKLGEFNINYPIILTPAEFQRLVLKEQLKDYYKEMTDAAAGQKEGIEKAQKNLLPEMYVNSGLFKTIFGGNTINVIPQGSVDIDLGILFSKQDNPLISPQNRSNFTFDFDQRISLSLLGKVGTRLQVKANYDTESTFDFQNLIKLEYDPKAAILDEISNIESVSNTIDKVNGLRDKANELRDKVNSLKNYTGNEDSILKKLEIGNVSMPLNSSLITGAQSLFGVKTQLQFGKTTVTAVFSEQQSQSQSVVAQGGGKLEEFEFFARDYDENRHFFLAHYFRDNYDKALLQYPYIDNQGLQITRVEVWITNRNNQTNNVRNIIAFQDLGESELENIGLNNPPVEFVNVPQGQGTRPDNSNNNFDPTNIGNPDSELTDAVRDITNVENGVKIPVNEGFDYGKLESARKLQEGQDYFLHTELGYISLNQRLLNDEILAVAFQYTRGGEVFQVGEFANDGINATAGGNDIDGDGKPNNVDADINGDGIIDNGIDTDSDGINDTSDADVDGDGIIDNGPDVNADGINDGALPPAEGSSQSLILKMLKSAVTSVQQPIWDLMMKNIYDTGAFQLDQEDFRLNIFYTEASPLNYITPVGNTTFPLFDNNTPSNDDDTKINETPLIRLFHLDRLNFNNDPQERGDGFFDFVPGLTVLTQNGKIIFTKAEPFGRYLFDVLDDGSTSDNYEQNTPYTNPNLEKYVYDLLYKSTKTQALDEAEKNKFQIKGRFKGNSNGGGIPIGAYNVPRGSVKVTAGGRLLVEGLDYTVNYQLGRVEILDEALKASNTPINVSVENNAVFGQQTKRFTGINVEHQFNENFVLGATWLKLNERPITQKANFDSEPINNTIFGFNGNYSSQVPFLTRLVNKLPNIDTDVPSNLSLRGEFAYLLPGAPKGTDFNGEATAYIDDFEGTQGAISLLSPQSWFLSSRPKDLPITVLGSDANGIENGFGRGFLNWYTIDPIFYSSQRPSGITDDDVSNLYTRRVFIEEIFPETDIVQGQTTVQTTLDLAYYPKERGPYNFDPTATNDVLANPSQSWAGITRQITSTDFEQANVEYIEFWVQDPFLDNPTSQGGKLYINLGNISEDILKDGKKQYENGLPEDGNINFLQETPLTPLRPYVTPQNQSLIYTFATTGQERINQDVGYDGYDDAEEIDMLQQLYGANNFGEDPAKDNYSYYLNTDGDIFERYKQYNGLEGNTPDALTNTNRGSTTQPDVEDINRDNTMNTINSYFEYEVDINPNTLNLNNSQINDLKTRTITLPNGTQREVTWYQFRLPINEETRRIGGISDIRSVRFARLYLNNFSEDVVLRFATLDLVRSDWRRYSLPLDDDTVADHKNEDTEFNVGIISEQENGDRYIIPPGVRREELNNNNNVIRQNEQSLVLQTCDLEPNDSRGVFKNINLDMRQYKKLQMFLHAEELKGGTLLDGDLIAFVRMGNDFTENFYQIEIPLKISTNANSPISSEVWPVENELQVPLEILQELKAEFINAPPTNNKPLFFNLINGQLSDNSVTEFSDLNIGEQRVAIKGNPNFGDIRVLMVGLKNGSNINSCGEVWFNELRMSGLDNEGGWAAVLSMDTNIADFADISATGRRSTIGFGGIEQSPNERSREDVKQYNLVTNVQVGQLFPKKWGVQIPFNYAQAEELITPEYDQFYNDLTLESLLNTAGSTTREKEIRKQSESYTKRKSINLIGVRKQKTDEGKKHFYNIENLTFNYSNNKVEHRDFEIESSLDQNVRVGANYNYTFQPIRIEPFKKSDSLFKGKYWKILKDFNFNLLPSSFSVNTDINRQFSSQKFREVELGGNNIGIEELFRRNYTFDFQYAINYNLTDNLSLNLTSANTNIVRNYFIDDRINGRQDPELDIWDSFFDSGDPNFQTQQLQVNYELPLHKIPILSFLKTTYSYNGTFQWQKGSDLNENLQIEVADNDPSAPDRLGTYNLGHSIQNSNTHSINTTLNMKALYKTLGLTKKTNRRGNKNTTKRTKQASNTSNKANKNKTPNKLSVGKKVYNTLIDIVTMVKRAQLNYTENNGTFLPGYLLTPGFIGTLRPTVGYTFGSQRDIKTLVANKNYLTTFPNFNQEYTSVKNTTLDYSINVEPLRDLKIDFIGKRTYAENFSENFRVEDFLDANGNDVGVNNGDGINDYRSLTPNTFGNFNISTALIKTAFSSSDENQSVTFDDFRANRLIIANRLAKAFYGNTPYNLDVDGYPKGFGKNSQRVLLPALLSAYQGSNPNKVSTSAFKDIPIPNWTLKYTGLMKIPWFKKAFRRFSIQHAYKSSYTINQYRTNLDYNKDVENLVKDSSSGFGSINPINEDANGNLKNERLYSNINLEEEFNPLVRLDFEMKNSIKVLAEIKKDRLLSLSFDNNLLTEIQGEEYTLGLGYRIKDLKIRSKLVGPKQIIKSDLNMRADVSIRDNKTIIRYLDLENNQVTAGQTIWGIKYTADYAFSKNLTAIFYFDYAFSDFAISTSFPQTSLRSGITLRYNFGN